MAEEREKRKTPVRGQRLRVLPALSSRKPEEEEEEEEKFNLVEEEEEEEEEEERKEVEKEKAREEITATFSPKGREKFTEIYEELPTDLRGLLGEYSSQLTFPELTERLNDPLLRPITIKHTREVEVNHDLSEHQVLVYLAPLQGLKILRGVGVAPAPAAKPSSRRRVGRNYGGRVGEMERDVLFGPPKYKIHTADQWAQVLKVLANVQLIRFEFATVKIRGVFNKNSSYAPAYLSDVLIEWILHENFPEGLREWLEDVVRTRFISQATLEKLFLFAFDYNRKLGQSYILLTPAMQTVFADQKLTPFYRVTSGVGRLIPLRMVPAIEGKSFLDNQEWSPKHEWHRSAISTIISANVLTAGQVQKILRKTQQQLAETKEKLEAVRLMEFQQQLEQVLRDIKTTSTAIIVVAAGEIVDEYDSPLQELRNESLKLARQRDRYG